MQDAQTPRQYDAGKISSATFERAIKPYLGHTDAGVLIGPMAGVDGGVIDIGHGTVMGVTTDPFFVEPAFGWDRAGWFAVHILASDAATSGLRPAYLTVDLNLPRTLADDELQCMWHAVHTACADIGVAIVTGHTARYDGGHFPMVGGATMLSLGAHDAYVAPTMARPGDVVVMTKGAGIETTGVFGALCADRIEHACGSDIARDANRLFESMSVVRDAQIAVKVGVRDRGVTSMHDATERGVWGGLVEIAEAADTGLIVHEDAILLRPETRAVCQLFDIDPYVTSSEGTLLVTCVPHVAATLVDHLAAGGIDSAIIGELEPANAGMRVVREGHESDLTAPAVDPFWPALMRALQDQPHE